MSENGVAPAPPEDDRTPTQEDLAPVAMPSADGWVMPEPVFRRSDGYTPQTAFVGNEDATVTPDHIEETDSANGAPKAANAESEIASQPEIFEESEPVTAAEPVTQVKQKRSWFRILLIVLGVLLLIAAATAVIVAVALGYFLQVSESQNLN